MTSKTVPQDTTPMLQPQVRPNYERIRSLYFMGFTPHEAKRYDALERSENAWLEVIAELRPGKREADAARLAEAESCLRHVQKQLREIDQEVALRMGRAVLRPESQAAEVL